MIPPPNLPRRKFLINFIIGTAAVATREFIKPESVAAQEPEITNPIDIAQTQELPVATFDTVSKPSVEGQQDPFSAGAILDYIDSRQTASIFLQVDTLPAEFADLNESSLSLALSGSLLMSLDQYYPEINSPNLDTSRRMVIVVLDSNGNILFALNIYPDETALDQIVTRIEETDITVRPIRNRLDPFPHRGITYTNANDASERGQERIQNTLN